MLRTLRHRGVIFAVLLCGACSFVGARDPRAPNGGCPATTATIIDGVVTGAVVGGLIYGLATVKGDDNPEGDGLGPGTLRLFMIVAASPFVLGFASSTIYGASKIPRCRDKPASPPPQQPERPGEAKDYPWRKI